MNNKRITKNFRISFNIAIFILAFIFLFNSIEDAKTTTVNNNTYYNDKIVTVVGKPFGIKLYTDGLLVVDTSFVVAKGNKKVYPAKNAGIKKGDIILFVNGKKITSNEYFANYINSQKGDIEIKLNRNGELFKTTISPVVTDDDNIKKVGLWVIDSTAGIGTMTFINKENNTFGALGHGITNSQTEKLLTLSNGTLSKCIVNSVNKSERTKAGELCGTFLPYDIGKIIKNNDLGIYGKITNKEIIAEGIDYPIASRYEIKEGKAYILCDIDSNGTKEYEINILKVSKSDEKSNKGLLLQITDQKLLQKTGGIVQGMSGTPIIQNGKLIGAVTHVFLNDSTKGYGIFIENMLENTD